VNNANQNIRTQRPGDPQINAGNFNNLVEKANANARQFGSGANTGIWRKTGGSTVSAPLTDDADLLQYHFQVIQVSKTTVEVHAGRGVRFAAGAINIVGMAKDGGGTGTEWENVATVTCSAAGFIKVAFNDSLVPTTLTASFVSGAYPTTDTDRTDLFIAQIFWDTSNSLIERVEQIWTGGDWDSFFLAPDDSSIDYNTSGQLQQYRWETAVDEDIDLSVDLISYKDMGGIINTQQYVLGDTLASRIAAWIGDNEDLAWSELSDTVGDPTNVSYLGYMPVVTRHGAGPAYTYSLDLTDLTATGVGPFWVKGAAAADCYGEEIGNDSAVKVVDLDEEKLYKAGGIATVDWANGTLINSTGIAVDWANQALEHNGSERMTWDADKVEVSENIPLRVLDDTTAGGDGGALTVLGGGYFGDGVYCVDSSNTAKLCDGTYAVNASGGGINANSTSGFLCAGTKVVGAQGAAVADATGAGDVVAQLNALLARVRTHGLIAT